MSKNAFLIISAAIVILSIGPAAANAQTVAQAAQTATISNDCTIPASGFAALQAIESNQTLTPAQELSQELAARKQLLSATISCAISEAQSLQSTLNAVSTSDSKATSIQSQLSGRLDDAINFYNLESAKLAGVGISGTEAVAEEMISWRTANYDPLAGQINNFILWSENQAIFATAQGRLTQTSQIVGFIESAAANNTLLASLSAAQSAFENAQTENSAAETALAESLPPDQSLALIQQSLQALADTYQKFTTLNDQIQQLLPTSQ